MNNSVFGKKQENLRNRVNVEVFTKRDVALKRACKPSFKRSMTMRPDIVVMQNAVSNLELNKPVYIGFSVLDLSKLHMYKFHYEIMLSRYEDNVRLRFTDTDSFLYEIEAEDIFQDMAEYIDDYDFSDYPKDRHLYNTRTKKVIGKFKDELNGMTLEELIGLRPKCYSLLFLGEVRNKQIIHTDAAEKQTAKGRKSDVKKTYLRQNHYKDTQSIRLVHITKTK